MYFVWKIQAWKAEGTLSHANSPIPKKEMKKRKKRKEKIERKKKDERGTSEIKERRWKREEGRENKRK